MVRRQAYLRSLVAGMVLCAATASIAKEDRSLQTLASDIQAIAQQHGVRGGGFALVQQGKISIIHSFGHADASGSKPVTDRTLFRVGSISKTVTALLALAVVEDGLVSLSSPVADVLSGEEVPESWAVDPPLRLVHLLEHTGGLPGTSYFEYAQTGENIAPA
ncbi:MAG: serine hydrolase domain-containing protein, partial [Pseudomonadota bacterium]